MSKPAWTAMPAAVLAARSGDYASLLRLGRIASGLTLEEAGRRAGYSASTLSRLETGRRKVCSTEDLRRLAQLYEIPPELVGLSPLPGADDRTRLDARLDDGGGAMRRRDLIAGAVVGAAGASIGRTDSAAGGGITRTLEDVLFGRMQAPPLADRQLAAQLTAAVADFQACRYTQLAHRLPKLLAYAHAGLDNAPHDRRAHASTQLAQAYGVATQLLIKLHDDGMACATADRAAQAARSACDPLVDAEVTRLAATVLRRAHHRDGAQRLVLHGAQQLDASTGLTDARQVAAYGRLLAVASYTAAMRDDRDAALELLAEADAAARRLNSRRPGQFDQLEINVYKISVARVLGDYGAAVNHAQLVDPSKIVSLERRARYWQDAALALSGRGRPEAAYRMLLAAEKSAPQEVRYRPWAQQLTRDLVASDRRNSLPDVRDFARRVGAI